MFRTIAIFGILALCAFMAGWFTIDRDDQETTIRFNRDEIRSDTAEALAKGREFLNNKLSEDNADGQMDDGQYYDGQFYDGQSVQDGYAAELQYQPPTTDDSYAPQQATRSVPPWQQPPSNQPSYNQY